MKKYILPLILLLAGCSSPTNSDDESGYPIQIKQWTIESPTLARWTGGVAAKSLAVPDSVKRVITAPEEFDLTITALGGTPHPFLDYEYGDQEFEIAWADTFKWELGVYADIALPRPPFPKNASSSITPIEVDGETVGTTFEYRTEYSCDSSLSDFAPIELTMFRAPEKTFFDPEIHEAIVHYEIHAVGYVETLNHLVCAN